MRRRIPPIFAILMVAQLANPPGAAARLQGRADESAITTGELISRIRDAGRAAIAASTPAMRDSTAAAVAVLDVLADHLEARLPAEPESSLASLRDEYGDDVEQALTALVLAEDLARALETCAGEDVHALLAAFSSQFSNAIGRPGSWAAERPRLLRLANSERAFGTVLRAGSGTSIVVEGANLYSDDCGSPSATLRGPRGETVEVAASIDGARSVTLELPALESAGVHEIRLRLRRKRLFFFCGSTTPTMAITVLPAAPFTVEYTVSTTQARVQEIVWNAGELKVTNRQCGDTLASAVFRLPQGWSYVSHEWLVFLNSGAVKEKEEVRGDEVSVAYRLPGKGRLFCAGNANLIHGRMEIRGAHTTYEPGPAIRATWPRPLAPGESVVVPVRLEPDDSATISEWSIEVRLIHPDGSVVEVPDRGRAGSPTGRKPDTAAFLWDPVQRTLELSAPSACCVAGRDSSGKAPPPSPATRAQDGLSSRRN